MSNEKRILIVSAHALDWLWRAGGTVENYIKEGAVVKVIDLSTGNRGESDPVYNSHPGITAEEVAKIRKEEVAAAAAELGIAEVRHFDYFEHFLMMTQDQIMDLAKEIRLFNPDIVLTHAEKDPKNPDHETAYHATIAATRAATAKGTFPDIPPIKNCKIFSFEPDLPELSDFKPDVFIDITDSYEIKSRAMRRITSQPHVVANYELRMRLRGSQCARFKNSDPAVVYGECFQRIYPSVSRFFDSEN